MVPEPQEQRALGASANRAGLKQTLSSAIQHEIWEKAYRTPRSEQFYEKFFDWLAAHAGLQPGALVLDIGCGLGAHAVRLARRGCKVVAADFSPDRVAAAKKFIEQRGAQERVEVTEEDLAEQLSFRDESFDGVLCWGVLMHIPENEKAMAELVRVTKKKGIIVVAEANLFSLDCAVSLGVGLARRMLGNRQRKSMRWTRYGVEYITSTPAGDLLVRHSRIPALVNFFREQGCVLRWHIAGQFTESFTRLGWMSRFAHGFNSAWFRFLKWPYFACGNILVFERERLTT